MLKKKKRMIRKKGEGDCQKLDSLLNGNINFTFIKMEI